MRSILFAKLSFLVLAIFLVSHSAIGQTSTFNYQGKVNDGGTAANGQYDFVFKLFPTVSGGSQIGPDVARDDVQVTNGVFSVNLDFGVAPFAVGAANYLEIQMRPGASTGAYTLLAPRQQITSTPYSVKSLLSDTAQNTALLSGISASGFIQNTTSQQSSSNFNISGNGIIGGNLGIGTVTPSSKLFVNGTGIIRATVNSDWNAGLGLKLNDQPKWSVATVAPGQFQIYNDAIGANAFWIDPTNNNVGIGTTSPNDKLEVSGFGVVRARVNSDSDARLTLSVNNQPKWSVQSKTYSNGNFLSIVNESTGTSVIDIHPNNDIEIKTFAQGGNTFVCQYFGTLAYCSSSLRYKTNIAPFGSGLNLIKQLSPITFNWKKGGMKDFGLGAEDVEKIEPLLVTYNDKGEVEGVKYDRVAVVLVNAVKEQQAQIEQQQTQIEQQQKIINQQTETIKNQQSQLDELKAFVCSQNATASFCQPKN